MFYTLSARGGQSGRAARRDPPTLVRYVSCLRPPDGAAPAHPPHLEHCNTARLAQTARRARIANG